MLWSVNGDLIQTNDTPVISDTEEVSEMDGVVSDIEEELSEEELEPIPEVEPVEPEPVEPVEPVEPEPVEPEAPVEPAPVVVANPQKKPLPPPLEPYTSDDHELALRIARFVTQLTNVEIETQGKDTESITSAIYNTLSQHNTTDVVIAKTLTERPMSQLKILYNYCYLHVHV